MTNDEIKKLIDAGEFAKARDALDGLIGHFAVARPNDDDGGQSPPDPSGGHGGTVPTGHG